IKKGTYALAAVGLVPYGTVILFGPFLFSFVFGAEWETAGEYARWIALWSYFGLMNRPSVRSFPVLNAQRFHLIFTLTMTILKLLLIILAYYLFKSDIVAIALFCMAGVISNVMLIYVTINLSKKRMVK
ncbi:MAG TPA: lipopolysaccharide biosynthesis protein, partial [Pseudogracilibacillus sp.]|nr:lipopolysaccharide biosynthesis protein [Pseudogracilibacillus sp.]